MSQCLRGHRQILVAVLWVISVAWFHHDISWDSTRELIDQRFPEVQQLSIDEFRSTYAGGALVIDAREIDEFSLSHLQGAVNARNPEDVLRLARERQAGSVVIYCSVGYRSSELAAKVQRSGFVPVFNLDGSLFEWANRGLPLHNDAGPTNVVHPYDSSWGKLLDPRYHPR